MTSMWRFSVGGAVLAAAIGVQAPASAQLDQAVQEAERATAAAAASQDEIDRISDQTGDLYREFRAVLAQIESQRLFVRQQEVFVQSQENEIEDIQRQIVEVDSVKRSLLPMQIEMIAKLDNFVSLDIPFKAEERRHRVDELKTLMDNPNVPAAEKYRKIVEAFLIEAEYGRTLAHYEDRISDDPDAPLYDFLVIGRVAFIYMAQDESELGIWNPETKAWDTLPGSYRADVRKAIRMAKQVSTPDVFSAPVPGPTVLDAG